MINRMDQQRAPGIDRRSLLTRGGAVAAGAIGAGVAGIAAASPAAAAGLGYTPITPFRSYDSRNDPAGKINFEEAFSLQLISDEGGTIVVPESAEAVTFNLTVTQTGTTGYLGLVPGGTQPEGFTVSTINWVVAGLDLANGGTTKLGNDPDSGPGSVVVYCFGFPDTSTHLVIDITGYFSP